MKKPVEPPPPAAPPAIAAGTSPTRKCPYCAEEIRYDAIKCKHCGEFLGDTNASASKRMPPSSQGSVPGSKSWSPGVAAVLSLVIPGAGQIYKGSLGEGIAFLVLISFAYASSLMQQSFGVALGAFIVHMFCVAQAYQPIKPKRRVNGVLLTAAALSILILIQYGQMYGRAREKLRRTLCVSNLRLIGSALDQYRDDNRGRLPEADWCDRLVSKGLISKRALQCPDDASGICSYAMNANLLGRWVQGNPLLVLVVESPHGWNGVVRGPDEMGESLHDGQYGVLYASGDAHMFLKNTIAKTGEWMP